jgi:hypothetical protein
VLLVLALEDEVLGFVVVVLVFSFLSSPFLSSSVFLDFWPCCDVDVEVVGVDEEDVLLVLALEDEVLGFAVVVLVVCPLVVGGWRSMPRKSTWM